MQPTYYNILYVILEQRTSAGRREYYNTYSTYTLLTHPAEIMGTVYVCFHFVVIIFDNGLVRRRKLYYKTSDSPRNSNNYYAVVKQAENYVRYSAAG